ncbi:MAG: polyphenol oxidase, partial [Chlamydiae bacterium]|nr:polyphenol oxidase [Chlamydiota bacterium]
ALGCYTADCAPVFLYSKDIKTIGIVHSGWQGTFKQINEKMIEKFKQIGAKIDELSVAIGPSISTLSYEVGQEFYDRFVSKDSSSAAFFVHKDGKIYYNNSGYIAYKYNQAGVRNIDISSYDTYTDDRMFSHRYYTHYGKKNGRMLSFILLN